jgi:hypothetical protein
MVRFLHLLACLHETGKHADLFLHLHLIWARLLALCHETCESTDLLLHLCHSWGLRGSSLKVNELLRLGFLGGQCLSLLEDRLGNHNVRWDVVDRYTIDIHRGKRSLRDVQTVQHRIPLSLPVGGEGLFSSLEVPVICNDTSDAETRSHQQRRRY